jgi:hypothetical protein
VCICLFGRINTVAKRYAYVTIGCLALFLGVAAIITPVLPALPFIIVSAFCFARGSDKFHTWITTHRIFGPFIHSYRTVGITPRNKLYYLGAIVLSVGISTYVVLELIYF